MKVTEQIVNSHNEDKIMEFLKGQLTRAFNLANQNLGTLDNGGYKVKFNGTIQRLENSDVKIKKTYIDRLDGNKTKKFDEKSLFGHTFTFQEAVEKMPGRFLFIVSGLMLPHLRDLHVSTQFKTLFTFFYAGTMCT